MNEISIKNYAQEFEIGRGLHKQFITRNETHEYLSPT